MKLELTHGDPATIDRNFQRLEQQSRSFSLVASGVFTITDHSGAKVFEVRDDGSVHIRTGLTVTADL